MKRSKQYSRKSYKNKYGSGKIKKTARKIMGTARKPKGTTRRTMSTARKQTMGTARKTMGTKRKIKTINSRTTKKLNTPWKIGDCIGPKGMWDSGKAWYIIERELNESDWLVKQQGIGGDSDKISKSLEYDPYWEKRKCPK
tara:strand:- start:3583 stop:4005 length:423 start_codon:yes stop_codon:yes gene_type:complete